MVAVAVEVMVMMMVRKYRQRYTLTLEQPSHPQIVESKAPGNPQVMG